MGFANPGRVSVYGRGAVQLQPVFTDAEGKPTVPTDITPCACWHENGRLWFYAQGPDHIGWDTSINAFVNKGKNIYSSTGVYFLTDATSPAAVPQTEMPSEAKPVTEAYRYWYHEADLQHNTTAAGQLFWGETITAGHPLSLPVELHEFNGNPATLQLEVYAPTDAKGTLEYTFDNAPALNSAIVPTNSSSYKPHHVTAERLPLPAAVKGLTTMTLDYTAGDGENIWLDYALLTYPCHMPSLTDDYGHPTAQATVHIEELSEGQSGWFDLPGRPAVKALDITDPYHPRLLPVNETEGSSRIWVTATSSGGVTVAVYDTTLPQPSPHSPAVVPNQDLHNLALEGLEMLIITVPELRSEAQRLADAHRQWQGMEVGVACIEEIYNEFSDGVPDPLAFRNIARMLYSEGSRPLRHLLFFGPHTADLRGLQVPCDPAGTIITYQNPSTTISKEAVPLTIYLGTMTDVEGTAYEKLPVEIAVGVLPCRFYADAHTAVDKAIAYMQPSDWSRATANMLTVGGLGDSHTHDRQAVRVNETIATASPQGTLPVTVAIDAYGNDQARRAMTDALERGQVFSTYIGHGAMDKLGTDILFFNTADVQRLSNTLLPFQLFAACSLTDYDRGQRGLAEHFTFCQPHGAIGVLASTRESWAGQNLDMLKMFFTHAFRTGNAITSPLRTQAPTIGEIWTATLTQCLSSNKLAYVLMCDPALVMPLALEGIHTSASAGAVEAGKNFTLSGTVITSTGNVDTAFDGTLTARVMLPAVTLNSGDLVTGTNTNTLSVTYNDRMVGMASCQVNRGRFELTVPVSRELAQYAGQKFEVYVSAFNPSTRIGATGVHTLEARTPVPSQDVPDTEAPVIEAMEWDDDKALLTITARDDCQMAVGNLLGNPAFTLEIDGLPHYGSGHVSPVAGSRNVVRTVALPNLAPGLHTARATVSDDSGNRTAGELAFTVNGPGLQLAMEQGAAVECARFTSRGCPDGTKIHILAPDGTEILAEEVQDNAYTWSLDGSDGKRVAPGLYRAYLRTGGDEALHSPTITVPVP